MFEPYRKTIAQHPKLPIREERKLILLAKKGQASALQKILRHLTGFFVYRIQAMLFPWALREHGEDILHECFLLATRKVRSFKLRRRGRHKLHPIVRFSTYIWKATTGLICLYLKTRRPSPVYCFEDETSVLVC